jgi:hypothetical protein
MTQNLEQTNMQWAFGFYPIQCAKNLIKTKGLSLCVLNNNNHYCCAVSTRFKQFLCHRGCLE